ncbi:hypothetical protein AWB91_09070 [Mycobacterium paraense]|uniref:Uncharacterized protein n=1 Tax=Mycobacterium paraense TaxID=767916 RepID=A0ABX3VS35_9MYCO|nr:hypothetical protein [Mycobacterium paraense]ORW33267.1 hypothetical protein AWB91_09070 [Mycobacterium paraense]ORW34672.1 hypothetical protein AWB88_02705 [Mycobacterium paraense]
MTNPDETDDETTEWATTNFWWHEKFGDTITNIRARDSDWWHQMIDYANQGLTPLQALGRIPSAWAATQHSAQEEFKTQLATRDDTIKTQAATITRMQRERDHLTYDDLPPAAQHEIMRDAMRRLQSRSR